MNKRSIFLTMLISLLLLVGSVVPVRAQSQTYIYVANSFSDSVTIFDMTDHSFIKSLSVCDNPVGVDATPNGDYVYYACQPGEVGIIDTKTNEITETIAIPMFPGWVDVSPDGNYLYIPHQSSGNLTIIEIPSHTVLPSVVLPSSYSTGVGSSPDNTRVYVTNPFDSNVDVIDRATNSDIGSIGVDYFPVRVEISPNGQIGLSVNSRSNNVSRFDPITNTFIQNIPVGNDPNGVAFTSDSAFAYVANFGGSSGTTVSVIDLSSNLVVDTITAGQGPGGIRRSPDGAYFYVANGISDSISIIDPSTNTEVNEFNSHGDNPVAVAFATRSVGQSEGRLYVSNSLSDSIAVFDATDHSLIDNLDVCDNPVGMDATPDGAHIYFTCQAGEVWVLNTATHEVFEKLSVSPGPGWLDVTPDGDYVYVTNQTTDDISVIDVASNTVLPAISSAGLNPDGVDSTPDNTKVYITNAFSDDVKVIDRATNQIATSINVGQIPVRVKISPDGLTALTVNAGSDDVSRIDTTTDTFVQHITVGDNPNGVAYTSDSAFAYVVNFGSGNGNTVSVVDLSLNQVSETISVGQGPAAIARSPDGAFIYVTIAKENKVSIINPQTNSVVHTFPSNGTNPNNMVFVTPPEPVTEFTVDSLLDEVDASPGNGVCASISGFCTLRAAIQETNALPGHNTINVPSGNYIFSVAGRSEEQAAQGDLDINDDVTILGAGMLETVIDASALDRIFHIAPLSDATVVISDMTIRNGAPGPPDARGFATGAGINIEPMGNVTIVNALIADNVTEPLADAGGIINRGILVLTGSIVTNNLAENGGGIMNTNGATVTILDSTISNNTIPGAGGGLNNNDNGYMTIIRSTISGNNATYGGGLNNRGTLEIDNSTISNNVATSEGGGIRIGGRIEYLTKITNSTIAENTSSIASGFYVYYSNPELENNIIAGNQDADNCLVTAGTIISSGFNLEDMDTCNFVAGTDLTDTDPILGSLQNNGGVTETHALLPSSPAIDSGAFSNCPVTDQRGELRPIDGDGDSNANCDRGAFEAEFTVELPTVCLFESDGISGILGAEVEYYSGGWNDFGLTEANGCVASDIPLGIYKFRMHYGGAKNDLTQDIGVDPMVLFQTVSVTVELRDSTGILFDTGNVEYYASGWNTVDDTSGGQISVELLPNSYKFRMNYGGAKNDITQDIGVDPVIVFHTVDVTLELRDSQGNLIDPGLAEYYASGWNPIGDTLGGTVGIELLPNSYKFRMHYGGDATDITQDISVDPVIVFQLASPIPTACLFESDGATGIEGAPVQYYSGGWNVFGTTGSDGCVAVELAPDSYKFRVHYGGATNDITQDIGVNPVIGFQTVNATVELRDSANALFDTGSVEYYAGGWNTVGDTSGGQISVELLPNSYKFRMNYGGAKNDITQDISVDTVIIFQTVNATLELRDSMDVLIDTGRAEYYSGGWNAIGDTSSGQASIELLPSSYKFRMNYGGAKNDITQDISINPVVIFQTGSVVSTSGTATEYYAGGWKPFVNGMQLLTGDYNFRFDDGTPDTIYPIVSGVENVIH